MQRSYGTLIYYLIPPWIKIHGYKIGRTYGSVKKMNMNKPKGVKELTEWINENSSFVTKSIGRNDVEQYRLIQSEFDKGDISNNEVFKIAFKNFYGLNVAALGNEFETIFFETFSQLSKQSSENIDFSVELLKLYKVKTKKTNTVQFSFFTKLVHTIDNRRAIYDSKVRFLFDLKVLYMENYQIKIEKYIEQYDYIEKLYEQILSENLLDTTLKAFDERFEYPQIHKIKKLDLIFWTTGKFFESEQNYLNLKNKTRRKV